MSSKFVLKLAGALAAVSVASAASAAGLTFTGASAGLQTRNSASDYYSPGKYAQWNGGSSFLAYCIDPKTGISTTSYSQITGASALSTFFNGGTVTGYGEQMSRAGYGGAQSTSANAQSLVKTDINELFSWAWSEASSGNQAKATGFGLALWEIILQNGGNAATYNAGVAGSLTGYSPSAGSFTSTGTDSTNNVTNANNAYNTATASSGDSSEYWFNQYLKALNGTISWATALGNVGATAKSWDYTIYYADNPDSQTFITAKAKSVPEPATLALAGLGLLGAVRFSRRNKKLA